MFHYLVPAVQDHGFREYLGLQGRPLADRFRILPYEELPARTEFVPGTYVLSAIEQIGPALRRLLTAIHRDLRSTPGYRFLNDPAATLGRFDLLTALHERGLNGFRVARATGNLDGLRYPVFLRAERSHDGAVSPLLGSLLEIEAAIGRALLSGRRLDDLLVVEFAGAPAADGLYRKYNAFVVGERIIPRGVVVGDEWMLKDGRGRHSEAIALEELEYVARDPPPALAEIRELARVEYGRIDFGMRDGRVETWEINLNPLIGRGDRPSRKNLPAAIEAIRDRSRAIFYAAFLAAFEAVEERGDPSPRRLVLDEALRRAAAADRTVARRPERRRALLHPLRPALERVGGGLLPWIGRLARRRPRPLSGH